MPNETMAPGWMVSSLWGNNNKQTVAMREEMRKTQMVINAFFVSGGEVYPDILALMERMMSGISCFPVKKVNIAIIADIQPIISSKDLFVSFYPQLCLFNYIQKLNSQSLPNQMPSPQLV